MVHIPSLVRSIIHRMGCTARPSAFDPTMKSSEASGQQRRAPLAKLWMQWMYEGVFSFVERLAESASDRSGSIHSISSSFLEGGPHQRSVRCIYRSIPNPKLLFVFVQQGYVSQTQGTPCRYPADEEVDPYDVCYC